MARKNKAPAPTLAEMLQGALDLNQYQQQVLNDAIRLLKEGANADDPASGDNETRVDAANDPNR